MPQIESWRLKLKLEAWASWTFPIGGCRWCDRWSKAFQNHVKHTEFSSTLSLHGRNLHLPPCFRASICSWLWLNKLEFHTQASNWSGWVMMMHSAMIIARCCVTFHLESIFTGAKSGNEQSWAARLPLSRGKESTTKSTTRSYWSFNLKVSCIPFR